MGSGIATTLIVSNYPVILIKVDENSLQAGIVSVKGAFFRGLWGKVIDLGDIKRLQHEIVEILCSFEMIFIQAFFNIMVHLPVHLCKEVEYGGLTHVRCMFPIERYLGKLKSYVRNRIKPEASIAEGYLVEEYLTFCSRFLNNDEAGRSSKFCGKYEICRQNMDKKEIDSLIEEHRPLQQKNKKATQVLNNPRRSVRLNDLQVNSPRRSSRLNNQEANSHRRSPCGDAAQKVVDAIVNLNAARGKRKLDLCNPPNEYEEMGDTEDVVDNAAITEDEETRESESEGLPPPPPLTNYEKERMRTKKVLKTKLHGGPTTRSRSNPVTAPQKQASVKDVGKKKNAEKKAAVASGTARQPVDGEIVLPDIGDDEAEEGPSEGVDELLLQGKSHGPTWLIGRYSKPDKRSTSGPTDSQITDLTTKIRQEVVNEMEEKLKQKVQEEVDEKVNKKVRENLTWVLMKLGEANPSININLGELCATISSDNGNGTPITDVIHLS
ncbi:hypothetical protein POM88_030446 [Heracleum sosnowskyi]|uniref:DUF4218 domain-containing protein n=1 Tax=Heracleum sosnowskyi TaxID=360622 RepID=A0AAD8MJE0_9APIA|nr:hypothetical protein POM88_030446 [Heracleum sosnowskyi]